MVHAQDDTELIIEAMKNGIHELLRLCSLTELRGICGGLNLVQGEDGEDCVQEIMRHVRDENTLVESKCVKVLTYAPEVAVFEYLRQIGAPLKSSFPDPKIALRK